MCLTRRLRLVAPMFHYQRYKLESDCPKSMLQGSFHSNRVAHHADGQTSPFDSYHHITML